MSFSKGLRVERSGRGIIDAKHVPSGLWVRRCIDDSWIDNQKISPEAWNKEMDRLEAKAIEALKQLYAHKYRTFASKGKP